MSDTDKLDRFICVIREMQDMYVTAGGKTHGHLEMLLNPDTRNDPRTLNYLKAGASGTLQDRCFCAANHDRVPNDDYVSFNRKYRALIDEALALAQALALPAGGKLD